MTQQTIFVFKTPNNFDKTNWNRAQNNNFVKIFEVYFNKSAKRYKLLSLSQTIVHWNIPKYDNRTNDFNCSEKIIVKGQSIKHHSPSSKHIEKWLDGMTNLATAKERESDRQSSATLTFSHKSISFVILYQLLAILWWKWFNYHFWNKLVDIGEYWCSLISVDIRVHR